MTPDQAYQEAKEKIEDAYRSGATELLLVLKGLKELPESVGRLTQLQSLDVSNNYLRNLPESLGKLTQLRSLSLSSNELEVLPECLGHLTQLESLDISNNLLIEFPEWLGQFTKLRSLNISDNYLTALPQLSQLTQLQSLDLSTNQLTALPEWLSKFTQLQTLVLTNNQLTTLPEWLGKLTRLQTLALTNNQLEELPEFLWRLRGLKHLSLHGNNALCIPAEILRSDLWHEDANPAEILDYYLSTRGEQGLELRELKLLVVGRGGAGKTSLIKRLNKLPLDPNESETHGINISSLELECLDGPVTARVWDFGGQHVLHAMHEFFLTARSLYLLVLGERDDMVERDADYWLQLIRSYAGSAPVVVALNKNKDRPREMDRESLERRFGPILAWVETECSNGHDQTIDNLHVALTEAANGMPDVRARFRKKWWQIKEWLENMTEPYLDYAIYQQQCHDLGETDVAEQERLAGWLNDLGIAINYTKNERLHDTTVLRPDWLANGIYAILRANDPRHPEPLARDAILTATRLGPIYEGAQRLQMLKAADYPAEKWPFLLQLMILFQLAFPLDDTGETLLVPTLLPVEPPRDCDEPEGKDGTRIRYEFAVVPGPLLPRLLVRMFSLIDDKSRWRRGAILCFKDARARVWSTQDERYVYVTAAGAECDRDELVTMIRVTLQNLIAEYRNLKAVEQLEFDSDWVPRRTLERLGVLPTDTYSVGGEREGGQP